MERSRKGDRNVMHFALSGGLTSAYSGQCSFS